MIRNAGHRLIAADRPFSQLDKYLVNFRDGIRKNISRDCLPRYRWKNDLKVYCSGISRAALVLMQAASQMANADRVAYDKTVDLSTKTNSMRAGHLYDWSVRSRAELWNTNSTSRHRFPVGDDCSYLLFLEKTTGAELFRRPVLNA